MSSGFGIGSCSGRALSVRGSDDTLAWAIGTRVGASDHAIDILLYFVWLCPGVLYFDTFTLNVWFNCAHK